MKRRLVKKKMNNFINKHIIELLVETDTAEAKAYIAWYKKFLEPNWNKRIRRRELVKAERSPFGRLVKVLETPENELPTDNLLRLANWPEGCRFYIQEDERYTLIIIIENGEKVAWEMFDNPRKVRPFLESFDWDSVNRAVNFLSEAVSVNED